MDGTVRQARRERLKVSVVTDYVTDRLLFQVSGLQENHMVSRDIHVHGRANVKLGFALFSGRCSGKKATASTGDDRIRTSHV